MNIYLKIQSLDLNKNTNFNKIVNIYYIQILSILIIIYIENQQIYCINNLKIIVINSKIDNLIKSTYTIYILRYLCIDKFNLYLEQNIKKQ